MRDFGNYKIKKMKKKIKIKTGIHSFWPVLVIILTWFTLSYPYFLQFKVPYPAAFQNSFFSPWSNYPEYTFPVKNNALSDVVTEIYPWKHFTIEEMKKGSIPWWNPYSFSGSPHIADIQTAVFSPFNILFFILPFIDAWSLLILLQPLLAGLFMLLFLRDQKISNEGSLIGSITFMFCGFLVAWMPYGTLSMAIAFLPLALYAINKCFEKTKVFALSLLSISIAVSFLSGHIQTSIYFFLYTIIYAFFKFFVTKNKKSFLAVLTFIILGLLISSIQLIPAIELYMQSVRSGLFSNEGAIPLTYLITVIAPDFFGNPVTRNDWVGHYAEWASYIGIIPFLLSCISLYYTKERKIILFFFITGLSALILAVDTPLQSLLTILKIPIFSSSIPSRIIVLFSFSFAVLASYGLDYVKNTSDKKNVKNIIIICSVLIAFLLVIWLDILLLKPIPKGSLMVAVRNFIIPTFSLVLISGLIFLDYYRNIQLHSNQKHSKVYGFIKINFIKITIFSLILLTLINSVSFAKKWVPFDPRGIVFPDLPVIKAMKENIGPGRLFGKLGSYVNVYYRLPSIEGYDPLYIGRYGEFIASANTGRFTEAVKSTAVIDNNAKYTDRVLDLLGVTMIFHVIGDTNKAWAYPVWDKKYYSKYSIVYHDDIFQLYKNKTALPRASLFFDFEEIHDNKEIIKRFYNDKFDYRKILILEQNPGITPVRSGAKGEAKIITYSPDKVIIRTSTDKPALLFLSDNYYPKWRVKINGIEGKILRADYTFRAVVVPAGKTDVEFYFDPWKFI